MMLHRKVTIALFTLALFICVGGIYAADDQLLVWIGNGAAPGKHSASVPGELVLLNNDGSTSRTVMTVPAQTSRVLPCGSATSPDGRHFTFYVGQDSGALYMMTGTGDPVPMGETQVFACLGAGGLRYSPNSGRLAYIAYQQSPTSADLFTEGALRVYDTSRREQIIRFLKVTAFDIQNTTVGYVQFFTNNRGEADEAAVFLWSGGENALEVGTLYPDQDCRFTSAEIKLLPNGQMILLMGHRCRVSPQTSWRFYTLDPSTRTVTLNMAAPQVGAFVPYARTNNLILSPSGASAYFTVPDGINAFTTGLIGVNLANLSPDNVLIAANAIMPKFDNTPYDLEENAIPVFSPDGRWLALVTNTPNRDALLVVVDLADGTFRSVSAGSRGDLIAALTFTPDNKRLVFVSGSSTDNALWGIELPAGTTFRIKRGRYSEGVISPDSAVGAFMEWQTVEDTRQPAYLTLSLVNITSGESQTVFQGATIVDGKVTEQKFAYPLSWRKG